MRKILFCGAVAMSLHAPLSLLAAASAEPLQPTALEVSATNPLIHPPGHSEHTARSIGQVVAPNFSESHSVYSVQLYKWTGKPGHERWNKLGHKQNVTVSETMSTDAHGTDLQKLQIAIPDSKSGHLNIPTRPFSGQMRNVSAEQPHIRLALHFYADNKQEVAQWLVESPPTIGKSRASDWKFQEVIASPLVTVMLPSAADRCAGDRSIIVKVVQPRVSPAATN